ncbi:PAN domain-containing protein [Cotonvirus japonicus]|uniref:PAN domain-containing protein n=1 Tax=Cotonvirus japonicus TaxID=2811091 RepID=A0ABM7NSB0_9VIRU|nr:PAN domain-containing protein [Cotonvirus japonicus]BCS83052.1 PAN domain-containing protein [Cotonvirus japonicus]
MKTWIIVVLGLIFLFVLLLLGFFIYRIVKNDKKKTNMVPINPIPPSTNGSGCLVFGSMPNTQIPGFNMSGMPLSISQTKCESECATNPDCDWFSYDTKNNQCTLKKTVPNDRIVTGFHIPDNKSGCPSWNRLIGKDIPGFNKGNYIRNIPEKICQQNVLRNGLSWYSYDNQANICYPKKGNTDSNIITGFPIKN